MSARKTVVSIASRAITDEVKAEYSRIERAKRRTMQGRRIDRQTRVWLRDLGHRICKSSILTEELSVHEKFAVIFVINHLFHGGLSHAGKVKDFIQRTIVLYHRDEITMTYIGERRAHRGTFEIKYDIWTTHLPKALVEAGALERANKPSVIGALAPKGDQKPPKEPILIVRMFLWLFGSKRSR